MSGKNYSDDEPNADASGNTMRYRNSRGRTFRSFYAGSRLMSRGRKFSSTYTGSKPKPYFGGLIDASEGKKGKRSKLVEKTLSGKILMGTSVAAIAGSFGYSLSTITGHAIGNLNALDANVTGTILFVLGVAGLLISLRRK